MYNKDLYNKLNSYFISKLGVVPYRRGWLKGTCPDCGKAGKFGINLSRDRTNCFVCGYNPRPINLVMVLEGEDNFNQIKLILSDYKGTTYIESEDTGLPDIQMVLPEGYKNIAIGDGLLAKKARAYIRHRGFNIEEVSTKGWGYCNSEELFGYIILPYYVNKRLVYYNARLFLGSGVKYKNPPIEEAGIGKSLLIYNSDALYTYSEVYVLEGIFNAETLGPQALATAGKMISSTQLTLIKKSPVSIVNIILDPDALSEAIRVAMDLVYYKKIRLVYWEGDKDVNDLGRKESLRIINSFPLVNYQDLVKLKNKVECKGTHLYI